MSHATVTIPRWAQGRIGWGQGGWTSGRFRDAIGQPVSIRFHAPTPIDQELTVLEDGDGWLLVLGETTIMSATRTMPEFATTEPVTVEAAADAKTRFPGFVEHGAPNCRSCGLGPESMGVHAGPLDDGTGRFATSWVAPTVGPWGEGIPDALVSMALDCSAAFYVGYTPIRQEAVTAQLTFETLVPIVAGDTYAIVAWDGRWAGGWDGRKRGAASCMFDAQGSVVAQADSFWVAAPVG